MKKDINHDKIKDENINESFFYEVEAMILDLSNYKDEKEARERRLRAYSSSVQQNVQTISSQIVSELVEERHKQKLTQQEIADMTGIQPSNIARFEGKSSIPTLVVLQKYAVALGKHIEIRLCDNELGE